MVLTTIELDGEPRKVMLHAPKNGFFYVIDRESGERGMPMFESLSDEDLESLRHYVRKRARDAAQ
jgi:glucose dehydrogenase